MILVQNQYKQGNRKNFESKLQLKQNTSKHFARDPKDVWDDNCERKSNFQKETWGLSCEENSDQENEIDFDEIYGHPEEIPENRRMLNPSAWRKQFKNVRFEGSDFNCVPDMSDTSSMENENSEAVECNYKNYQEIFGQKPSKINDHLRCQLKWRNSECYDKKCERRPKSSPEKSRSFLDVGGESRPATLEEYEDPIKPRQKGRRKEHKCLGRLPCGDTESVNYFYSDLSNPKSLYKFDYGDDFREFHQGDCCDHFALDKEKVKNHLKHKFMHQEHSCQLKDFLYDPATKSSKKKLCKGRQFDTITNHVKLEHCFQPNEYCSKGKKKALAVVHEKYEQLSDSTYRIPCSKLSSHTVPNELIKQAGMGPGPEKMINPSQSDWSYWSRRNSMDKIIYPTKFHKTRSRRTRMNRLKNGWKKAFVQTVRDESHNEKVGVIIMGPKGPEYYSKNKQDTEVEPPKNSNPDPFGPKSFEVMAVDCKNLYLTSSDPRTYTTCNLPLPEDETKADEELENFSRNVSEIVKASERSFYKSLSTKTNLEKDKGLEDVKKDDEERKDVDGEEAKNSKEEQDTNVKKNFKKSPLHLMDLDNISPAVPKSLTKRDQKFIEASKAMADALNKQAREYKENQLNKKDVESNSEETVKHLQQNFSPVVINEDIAKANLSVWGMTLDHLSDKKDQRKKVEEDSDCDKSNNIDSANEKNDEEDRMKKEKLNQLMSPHQRSNKTSDMRETRKFADDYAGDEVISKQLTLEPSSKRLSSTNANKWSSFADERKETREVDADPQISEMFHDLAKSVCDTSRVESQNLQNLFSKMKAEERSNNEASEISSESQLDPMNKSRERAEGDQKAVEKNEKQRKEIEGLENSFEESSAKKFSKLKARLDEKIMKRFHNKEKAKKKLVLEDKMKVLREALPGIAAENEAVHLKQLKKYIERFIERVEASTCSEFQKRRQNRNRIKDVASTDSSEVRVDARKILDIVNNPFKTISSDVTINIAKKLTDALVQEKSNKTSKNALSKAKKSLAEAETDDERFLRCETTSGSGKSSSPGKIRLKVEAFLRTVNFLAMVTYGVLAVCGVIVLVKKSK